MTDPALDDDAMGPEDITRLFYLRANQADVDGVVALYREDALLITPTGTVVGRAEIREFYAELLSDRPTLEGNAQVPLKVGDLALTSTRYQLISGPGAAPRQIASAEIAQRQANGAWRWVIDQPNIVE